MVESTFSQYGFAKQEFAESQVSERSNPTIYFGLFFVFYFCVYFAVAYLLSTVSPSNSFRPLVELFFSLMGLGVWIFVLFLLWVVKRWGMDWLHSRYVK